jgi:hypothetical protein
MLYAGLDLSRKRLDFHLLDGEGTTVDVARRRRTLMVFAD